MDPLSGPTTPLSGVERLMSKNDKIDINDKNMKSEYVIENIEVYWNTKIDEIQLKIGEFSGFQTTKFRLYLWFGDFKKDLEKLQGI